MLDGEREADASGRFVRGALLLGLRKTVTSQMAESLVGRWLNLREDLKESDRPRMYGVDSIGYETGFELETHQSAFELARSAGQWLQMHVGERWPDEPIESALLRLQRVINARFNSVVNMNALLADPNTLSAKLYSDGLRASVAAFQEQIVVESIKNQTWLQFSPESNKINSSADRNRMGWGFRRLDAWIEKGLLLLPTEDDPGIFETNLPLEFFQLYMGTTAYGPISYAALKRLVFNSGLFAKESLLRLGLPMEAA
jgi:hypothetical protein